MCVVQDKLFTRVSRMQHIATSSQTNNLPVIEPTESSTEASTGKAKYSTTINIKRIQTTTTTTTCIITFGLVQLIYFFEVILA